MTTDQQRKMIPGTSVNGLRIQLREALNLIDELRGTMEKYDDAAVDPSSLIEGIKEKCFDVVAGLFDPHRPEDKEKIEAIREAIIGVKEEERK